MIRARTALVALMGVGSLGLGFPDDARIFSALDPVDPATGRPFEVVPGAPFIREFEGGESDLLVDGSIVGDVDLVVRTGAMPVDAAIGPPAALSGGDATPVARVGPPGQGDGIPFWVTGSSVDPADPNAASFPYGARSVGDFSGIPVAVAAFADLDGDGFIGVTLLDGDAGDAAIEEAELVPAGRHLYVAGNDIAQGELHVGVGGPVGARVRVVLTAAAYIGPFTQLLGGNVPDGPAAFTHMPYLPRTDPFDVVEGGNPIDPLGLPGFEIEAAFTPDPTDLRYGEAFALATDGTTASIDAAEVESGAVSGFAVASIPDAATYEASPSRPLRPGIDSSGGRVLYEIPRRLHISGPTSLNLVPVDQFGNVADPAATHLVTLRAGGSLRILAPDLDGDPARETLLVADSSGGAFVLAGSSGGPGIDQLVIDSSLAIGLVEVVVAQAAPIRPSWILAVLMCASFAWLSQGTLRGRTLS